MKSTFIFFLMVSAIYKLQGQQTSQENKTVPNITCGNLLFTIPAGWKLQADGENYLLVMPPLYNDPQRWVNILIFKGGASSGSIDTDFDNVWYTYLGNYTKYEEPYLIKEKSSKGYNILRGGTNIKKGNEAPLYAHLWVAKVKDKMETVIVIANYINDFEIVVNTLIKPFWAKLKFKNLLEEATENYTLKGTGIQGIYSGVQSGMRMSGGIAKNISFLIVYNDGKLKSTNKLPDNGFEDFDRETDREINAGYWGDYDLKNGTVVFDKNAQPRKLSFTYQPPKIIYNDIAYTKIPLVDGLTLTGVYTADQSPIAVDAFGHEPTITFFKDGRFEDNTALYYVKSYDDMFKNPGKGKYSISNFTINLLYDDGRGGASFSFITWDTATNRSIQIGENVLLKK